MSYGKIPMRCRILCIQHTVHSLKGMVDGAFSYLLRGQESSFHFYKIFSQTAPILWYCLLLFGSAKQFLNVSLQLGSFSMTLAGLAGLSPNKSPAPCHGGMKTVILLYARLFYVYLA